MNGRPIAEQAKDLIGKRFGTLIIMSLESKNKRHYFNCQCECGAMTKIRNDTFYGKHKPQSCGCKTREIINASQTTHGLSKTPEYRNYVSMLARCYNKNTAGYEYYNGKGITVCQEWRDSFEVFLKDMGTRPTRSHSIDRLDNSKGYFPENCRWASKKEQAMNRDKTSVVTICGVADSYCGHSKRHGLSLQTVKRRHEAGMPDELIVSRKRYGKYSIEKYKKIKQAA